MKPHKFDKYSKQFIPGSESKHSLGCNSDVWNTTNSTVSLTTDGKCCDTLAELIIDHHLKRKGTSQYNEQQQKNSQLEKSIRGNARNAI